MHILLGAVVGAVLGAAIRGGIALATGQKVTMADLLIAAGAGAVGGAVATATLGIGAGAATTLPRSVAAFSAGGASDAATYRVADNVHNDREVTDGLLQDTALGASAGALPIAGRVLKPVVAPVVNAVGRRLRPSGASAEVAAADAATDAVSDTVAYTGPQTRGMRGVLAGEDATAAQPVRGQPGVGSAAPDGPAPTAARGRADVEVPARRGPPDEAANGRRGPPDGALGVVYRSIHPPAPAWLQARFQDTIAKVARGGHGPRASTDDVANFLQETYEHINEVNALVRALGGNARDIPASAGSGQLRGIHDFGEAVSLRRFREFVEEVRVNPLKDRDGNVIEAPAWLFQMLDDAVASGQRQVDVGKLSPQVASGLGRTGPPDLYSIKLHNLSPHHHAYPTARNGRLTSGMIEAIADKINAMRQPRIYRPEPMSVDRIRGFLLEDIERGLLPPEARPMIDRALETQLRLEREGLVNPYYLLEGTAN